MVMSGQFREARRVARSPRRARHEIDRNSPLPLYAQVRRGLEARLAGGEWRPGDRIPGEPELCKEYGVSRPVIRQALQELAMEGAIVRREGTLTCPRQTRGFSTYPPKPAPPPPRLRHRNEPQPAAPDTPGPPTKPRPGGQKLPQRRPPTPFL